MWVSRMWCHARSPLTLHSVSVCVRRPGATDEFLYDTCIVVLVATMIDASSASKFFKFNATLALRRREARCLYICLWVFRRFVES